MSELDVVIEKWENEVNEEVIIQIEYGESPHEARNIAEILVKNRRSCKNADKE